VAIFRKKDATGNLECNFAYMSGLSNYEYKAATSIKQNDSQARLEIRKRASNEEPLLLNYSQIIACGVVQNLKIEKDGNNAVSSAVIGGLILGPIGAIVGGMSGVGSKGVTIPKCFIINYRPTDNPNDTKAILLEIVGASLHWDVFVETLKTKTNALPQQSKQL